VATESVKSLPQHDRVDVLLLLLSLVYFGLAAINAEAALVWRVWWHAILAGVLLVAALGLLKVSLPRRTKRGLVRRRRPRLRLVSSRSETSHRPLRGLEVPDTVELFVWGSQ
jgi:hypothetical protein